MTEHLCALPNSKWESTERQIIANSDHEKAEKAILESFWVRRVPSLIRVDNAGIRVEAAADSPANVVLCGVPNFLHPGQFVSGGLSDGRCRENAINVTSTFWGTAQAWQWYAVYAKAAAGAGTYGLKLMPWLRVKGLAGQTISCGTLVTPATGRKYGFTANELVGGKVYVWTGDDKGVMYDITANDENATETTITVGAVPSLVAGDWFLVLPPALNIRWLGDVLADGSGHLVDFAQDGPIFRWVANQALTQIAYPNNTGVTEDIRIAPPLATMAPVLALPETLPNAGTVLFGHPTLLNHQVLMFKGLQVVVDVAVNYPDPSVITKDYAMFTPGFQPVPIEVCKYFKDAPNGLPVTPYSGGYGYRPELFA